MPISRQEFDDRRLDLRVPIYQILDASRHLAFTAAEIQGRLLTIFQRRATVTEVAYLLESLVAKGQVMAEELGGER